MINSLLKSSKDKDRHATMVLSHCKISDLVFSQMTDWTGVKKKKNPWELFNWLVDIELKFEDGRKYLLQFKSTEDAEEFMEALDDIERNKER